MLPSLMKLGCFGCFTLVVLVLAVLAVTGGVLFLSVNVLGSPDVRPVSFSRADGYAARRTHPDSLVLVAAPPVGC